MRNFLTAAEQLVFQEVSSGALDDLERASKQAYAMVSLYGFSEKVGNVSFYDTASGQNGFQKPYSEDTAELIDQEVRNLMEEAFEKSMQLVTEHFDRLQQLAERLLKDEVVSKEVLEEILGPRKLNPEQTVIRKSVDV